MNDDQELKNDDKGWRMLADKMGIEMRFLKKMGFDEARSIYRLVDDTVMVDREFRQS